MGKLQGKLTITIGNKETGDVRVISKHNTVTNVVSEILDNNIGGVLRYATNSTIMPLYSTLYGGILLHGTKLTSMKCDPPYTISAYAGSDTSNAYINILNVSGNDHKKGKFIGTTISDTSITHTWEWDGDSGVSFSHISLCPALLGNTGTFLCHYRGDGQNWYPANMSAVNNSFVRTLARFTPTRWSSGIDGSVIMGINNNVSYSFKVTSEGVLTLYSTPIIIDSASLQGRSLIPNTEYTETRTINLNHKFIADNCCMFHFDFNNNRLWVFSVYSEDDVTDLRPTILTSDAIDLTTGEFITYNTNHTDTGYLWTIRHRDGDNYVAYDYPLQAMVSGNTLYFPICVTRRPVGWDYYTNRPQPCYMSYILLPGLPVIPDIPWSVEVSVPTYVGTTYYFDTHNSSTPDAYPENLLYKIVTSGVISMPSYHFAYQLGGILNNTGMSLDFCPFYSLPTLDWYSYYSSLGDYMGIVFTLPNKASAPKYYGYYGINVVINEFFCTTECDLGEDMYKDIGEYMRIEYTLEDA